MFANGQQQQFQQPNAPVVTGVVVGSELPASPLRSSMNTDFKQGHVDIIHSSCRDASLPSDIRLAFVKKVYGILGSMLLITFGIASPFVFATDSTMDWMNDNKWLFYAVLLILMAQHLFNMCMMMQMCCGGSSLYTCYMKMFTTVPANFLYLIVYACCFGVVTGYICGQYTVESVLVVFAISFALILALTAYAVYTKADFTGFGVYILVALLGLLFIVIVGFFFPMGSIFHRIVGGIGATIFGFLIVYDTQLIFGSASVKLGGGSRQFEYSIDMYAFAAYNLYLDFVNFFLFLLQLFGERK
jgi:hypothetical protein